ncbi:iron ABC transporter permease [uncultured Aureimonas sp.]|uniref:ABC transporter permease n=1 Tax=uncultured Aureimonas sp. TaxID=1604662 RepID=UPI0025D3345A|nr:ABC transporter permease subunit [uncultured Aureimonas sp.]
MADASASLEAPAPARRPLARAALRPETVLAAALLLVVALIGTWPLLRLLSLGFLPGDDGAAFGNLVEAWASRAIHRAFWNTLAASLGATAIAVTLGAGLALLLACIPARRRALPTFLLLSPLLVPSQIMALAWIELTGLVLPQAGRILYSGPGVALLLGIEAMPLVFLAVRAGLALVPGDLVDAARIAGVPRGRILRRIVLPLLVPAIAGSAALAFAACVGNFGIPALLGIPGRFPMLTTLAYQRLNGFGTSVLPQVAVIALVLVALSLGALALRSLALRALAVPVERVGGQAAAISGTGPHGLAPALVWSGVAVVAVLPMLALVAGALTPALGVALTPETATLAQFRSVLASEAIRRALFNSLALSLGMAAVAGALAVPLAYLATVRRNPVARAAAIVADAPFVVPGTVLALAFILVFLPPLPGIGVSLYATPWILALAYLARFLPLVTAPVAASFASLDPALDDAARVSGVGLRRRMAFLALPLAGRAAAAGMLLAALTAFNELTVSALLWSAGTQTVGVMVFSLQYEGNSGEAAALSVLATLLVAALAVLADRLGRGAPGALPWRD